MDKDNIASAQVLLRIAQSGGCRSLPETGDKLTEPPPPGDAWLAAEQGRARTEQLFSIIAEPLAAKRSDLLTAAWLPLEDRAELNGAPGKYWQYMGYEQQRRKFLRWEEAVMLCEMGLLQLTVDGQRCSLQEVRARLLAGPADRERQYRLYAHLTRLGYRPVRHDHPVCRPPLTDYERKIGLDQYIVGRKSKRHRACSSPGTASPESKLHRGETGNCDSSSTDAAQAESESDRMVDTPTDDRASPSRQQDTDTRVHAAELSARPAEMATDEDEVNSPSVSCDKNGPALKRLDFTADRHLFPRVPPGAGIVTLESPPAHLLPLGVQPRNHYCLDVSAARRGQRPERSNDKPRDRYPSSLPALKTPVRNWAEFKRQSEALSAAGGEPEATVPDGPSGTLVPPRWRGSVAQLLARLRLAPAPTHIPVLTADSTTTAAPAPTATPATTPAAIPAATPAATPATTPATTRTADRAGAGAPPPLYDVFPSETGFRKSAPPPPEFRVFIVRPAELVSEVPSAAAGDGVPLCAAVLADVGPPALYTVLPGRLPIDWSVLHQSL